MKKSLIVVILLLIGLVLAVQFLKKDMSQAERAVLSNVELPQLLPTATPSPFQELTIPYLRSRSYQSDLTELTRIGSGSNYTSYLTSYNSDGLKINGLLTRPTGEQPDEGWPAVIFVHGYIPPNQYRTQEKYEAYVDYLARNGLVVFKIDLRGHGSSEGSPGGAYYSSDYIIDVLNAHAALQAADFVNAEEIGLWGHSMAGNVVLRSMAVKPDIPAAVIWAGAGFSYEDLQQYGISDASYQMPRSDTERQRRRRELFDTHGQFQADSQFWQQVSPINYLSELQGAIELHHAEDDTVVNPIYSKNLADELAKANVPYEAHFYASGGHNISGNSFSTAMQRTTEFFRTYLSSNE